MSTHMLCKRRRIHSSLSCGRLMEYICFHTTPNTYNIEQVAYYNVRACCYICKLGALSLIYIVLVCVWWYDSLVISQIEQETSGGRMQKMARARWLRQEGARTTIAGFHLALFNGARSSLLVVTLRSTA